jgi:BspA type Leucine rich repeat region (6 copies)
VKLLVLLFQLAVPIAVQAQLTFVTNNQAISITGYTGNPTVLVIPGTTNGYPVTSIASNAFLNRFTLKSVTIPDSVTNIGDYAFDLCSSMTNFTFGTGLTSIGVQSFILCSSLTSITIPDSVTTIGNGAFQQCQSLTNFVFGSGVTTIGSSALCLCSNLTSITVPNSVTNIGTYAFLHCAGLTNINIGNGVTSIGQYPLDGCTNLASATIGIPNIEYGLFLSLTRLGGACPSLTSLTLLDSVTNIGNYAFDLCTGLTNITIPQSVTSIGIGVFPISVTAINVDSNNTSYSSLNGVLFDASQSTLVQYPLGLTTSSYTVPITVTNLGTNAFEFNLYLRQIYFMTNAPSYAGPAFFLSYATIYYLPGTTGWGPTYDGQPTAPWLPQMQTLGYNVGGQTNQFGFNISWATGQTVVVEACTNLASHDWQPLQTNMLTTGSAWFGDPLYTNSPSRFYRLCSP